MNPDHDSVAVVDEAGALLAEIGVGDQPWSLAKRPGVDEVFVTNKGSSSISVIDTVLLSVDHSFDLPRGAQPHGIVFSGDGVHYFVVLEALEKRVQWRQAMHRDADLADVDRAISAAEKIDVVGRFGHTYRSSFEMMPSRDCRSVKFDYLKNS